MRISSDLCALALRSLVGGACKAVGFETASGAVDSVVGFLVRHFSDHSQRLLDALHHTNDRAWRALEVALAGDSLWDRCKLVLASGDEKGFREQVRPFLDTCSLAELQGRDAFRQACLNELRAARKAGLLSEGKLDPTTLAQKAGAFARFDNPQAVLDAEHHALVGMGEELRAAGYPNLGAFIELRPRHGQPLLVAAARYFFRRAVETDEALFQGLAFSRLEQLQESTDAAFAALEKTLTQQGEQMLLVLGEVQAAVAATHGAVLDVRAEQQRQGEQVREVYQAVIELQSRLDLANREVRPSDSLSLRNDNERALVKQLVAKYRDLPEQRRQDMPALLNAIGKLEVAAGDFASAQRDFEAVTKLTADAKARAEAHANAYRAALESRDWDGALKELLEAVKLDRERFMPFPMDKYRPQRILGAGGFGVAFLCEHRFLKAPVVVKTLSDADLDRGVDVVFAEAQALRQLDHSAIIRLQDCGFGSPDGEARPYLVVDYFEGTTLEDAVREHTLDVEDAVAVGRLIASGLQAAHEKGILHRDVKPANVLVQGVASLAIEGGDVVWKARLIDFGLALRRTGRETMLATSKTLVGSSIAGTLDYAAPEQMGKLTSATVGPYSDVYGFGRTMCYALFQTPQPLMRHWRAVPPALAELLESCVEEDPKARPKNFAAVLEVLDRIAGVEPKVPVVMAPPGTEESRRQELTLLTNAITGCTKCKAIVPARQHAVPGAGPLSPDLFFVGEAPGAEEDRTGKPFLGPSGQLFGQILGELGIARDRVFVTNALKCKPPGRKGEPGELNNCAEHLRREIEIVRPKVIVCLGGVAASVVLNNTSSMASLRGRVHNYRGTPVVCTYHPAYLLRNPAPQNRQAILSDIRLAQKQVK